MKIVFSTDGSVKTERIERNWTMSFDGVEFSAWDIGFLLKRLLAGELVGRDPKGSMYSRSDVPATEPPWHILEQNATTVASKSERG